MESSENKFYRFRILSDRRSYIGMSFKEKPSDSIFFRHLHNDFEVFVLIEGNCFFCIENEKYRLTDNCIIIIPAGKYHYYEKLDDGYRTNMVINLEKNTLKKLGLYDMIMELIKNGPVYDTSSSPSLCKLLTKPIAKLTSLDEEKMSLYYSCVVQQLILELGSADFSVKQKEVSQSEITQQIVKYINDNIDKPLSLESIAKNLFLSQSYVSHKFLSEMRIGVMAYVKAKRIVQAKILMQKGVKPTEVFGQIGFNDYTTFFRAFKKDTGITPSEFFNQLT